MAAGTCPMDVTADCPSGNGNYGYNNTGGCGNVGCNNHGECLPDWEILRQTGKLFVHLLHSLAACNTQMTCLTRT